jgi:DNA-binding protein HU-beta
MLCRDFIKFSHIRKEKSMNKSELIEIVAQKTGFKKKDTDIAVSAVIDAIGKELVSGKKVQISGLGTFDVKVRASRVGRNPKTQETIEIPASKHLTFSASKTLKEAVNK